MDNKEPIVKEVTIDASPSQVWKALTEPQQIVKWFMPADDFVPQVGKTFHMRGKKDGVDYPHTHTITEIIPEKKLAYTWKFDGHPGETLVTYSLEEAEGKTKLTLTHSGWENVEKQHPVLSRNDYNGGWTYLIGTSLKAHVEKQ